MPKELSQMVARGLSPMTACGFLTKLSQAVVDDVERHITEVERVRVVATNVDNDLLPVAFVASSMHKHLYHLGGIIVSSQEQGKGIGHKIIQDELLVTDAELLGFHTQSKHMKRLGEKLSNYHYHLALIRAGEIGTLTTETMMIDDQLALVQPARYGGASLYGDLQTFTQMGRQIQGLNTKRGDALVYVGFKK